MASTKSRRSVAVCLEVGGKRVFASALDWPGWSRSGRDEQAAIDALHEYRARYAPVVELAGLAFGAGGEYEVVERVRGSATTDFGAPGTPAAAKSAPLTAAAGRRTAALVAATWRLFDTVVAGAPASLRKGPRGGGRDRDAIVDHVLGAEHQYARKLGVRVSQPHIGDDVSIAALREAVLASLTARRGKDSGGWPARYAARRIAWHVLDHAWEIEDRSEL